MKSVATSASHSKFVSHHFRFYIKPGMYWFYYDILFVFFLGCVEMIHRKNQQKMKNVWNTEINFVIFRCYSKRNDRRDLIFSSNSYTSNY